MLVKEKLQDIFFPHRSLHWPVAYESCWWCKTLPWKHDDTMRNFVLAQALPAASYQLLVFPWQLLHPPSGCKHETSSSGGGGGHTTPLQDKEAQFEESHNIWVNPQTKLPGQPTWKTKRSTKSVSHSCNPEVKRGTGLQEIWRTNVLYLLEASLLSELLLVQPGWGVCVCECLCVFAGSSLAWHSGALALSSPGPRCSQADKLCHALICHTGCYLSLPFLLASWYALSPALGILFKPLKEKKRDLSLLLQRGCSEPQLLLQVNQGLKHTETIHARTT